MRTVNEQIAALGQGAAGWADPAQQFDFACECGRRAACDGRVVMSLAEYEVVRRQDDRFAVVPGHETDEIESVVEQNERYVIVDKRAPYEQLVD